MVTENFANVKLVLYVNSRTINYLPIPPEEQVFELIGLLVRQRLFKVINDVAVKCVVIELFVF